MAQSKLEEIAITQRNILIARNVYNNESDTNTYNPTHSRAISDDATPKNGKGTGEFLDVFNGGSSEDIYGNAAKAGSGRLKNIAINKYKDTKPYTAPDTTQNNGQVTIV